MSVEVSLRLRPTLEELDQPVEGELTAERVLPDGDDGCCSYRSSRFRFARIFQPEASNSQVFEAHRVSVLRVLRGFDCTLMAYGATGSGKTHTMMGHGDDPGIVPLAAAALFDAIAAAPPGVCYSLQLSALEILEERCVDLLHGRRSVLLRASGEGGLHFHGLDEVHVRSKAELLARFAEACGARTVAANYRHEHSSRAHTVVRVRVESAVLPDRALTGTLVNATSAVLTVADLAGSEAATLNTNAATVAQGVAVNKSLHWLKAAVHDLGTRQSSSVLRNSALTRLLQPALSGQAVVAVVVTSPVQPPPQSGRDTLEALQFGVAAGRLQLAPTRRTEAPADGQLGRLQALLAQMADDKTALAADADTLREQVAAYTSAIEDYRSQFVSSETLLAAEREAERVAAELRSANERNEGLEAMLLAEQAERDRMLSQMEAVEAAAAAAAERNRALQQLVTEAAEKRAALEERLQGARDGMEEARAAVGEHEAQLERDRWRASELEEQVGELERQLAQQQQGAEATRREAEALATHNSALQQRVWDTNAELERTAQEKAELAAVAQAKDQLLLLRHKMYRSKRRPATAGVVGSSQPSGSG